MEPKFQHSPHFMNYWEKGNGKELLDWAAIRPNLKIFEDFAPLYHQVDHLGDDVVRETYLKLPYPEASAIISKYSTEPVGGNSDEHLSIKNFFLQFRETPDWFDEKLANKGARLCMRTGANGLMILRDFSLMGGYDFAFISKPLIFTEVLKKGAVKRLKDTLDFWINVTRENALVPYSKAFHLIVRTRLRHSYARLKIKEKTEIWDYENWGEPINLWDMTATCSGFSLVFMQGLKKLGIIISEEEERGLFHLWKYVGYLLGIPAEFLPENRQDAVEQFYWWTTIQDAGDEDSAQLARALLQENLENTIYKHPFQRKILMKLHQSMNWFLLDDEILHRLAIPKPPAVFSLFPKLVVQGNRIFQKIYLLNAEQYQKLTEMGDHQQRQVLQDYIEHTPKSFHY